MLTIGKGEGKEDLLLPWIVILLKKFYSKFTIICICATDFVLLSIMFFVSKEFLYALYSSLTVRRYDA
jgi:hypothetical protein